MSTDRPIVVMGCPRSGTTLLTLMLSAHSRLAIPPETRFLLPIYRRHREFGDLRERTNRRRLARVLSRRKGTKLGHLRLERDQVRKAVRRALRTEAPTMGVALAAVFRCYAQVHGKSRWGVKQPSYVGNVDVIRQLWPDAQFVHLVRDGRDCIASLKQMSWWHHGMTGALATWVHSVDLAERAARRLPAGSFHELRYEDLVATPRTELERLCAFLGEEFEEAMLTPHVQAALLPRSELNGWHRRTAEPVGTGRIGTYASVLTADETALVGAVAGSRLRRLGYDVAPSRRRPPARLVVGYLQALWSMRVRTVGRRLLDRRLAADGAGAGDSSGVAASAVRTPTRPPAQPRP